MSIRSTRMNKLSPREDIYSLIPRNQTLVVDSSMRVMDILPWTRAMSMVMTDVAWTLLADPDGRMVHSVNDAVPWPIVVCLYRTIKLPRGSTYHRDDPVSKRTILERDGWVCQYCHGYGDTIDHVMPRSRGGLSSWGNLVCACHHCNMIKADNTPDEAGMEWPHIPSMMPDWRRNRFQSALFTELTALSS